MLKNNPQFRDVLIVGLLIVLQIVFTLYFPVRSHLTSFNDATITREFLWLVIDIPRYDFSTFYFPFLSVFYTLVLVKLLMEKEKHLALIYGLALVLFVQLSFVVQLFSLEGSYSNIYSKGVFVNSIENADAQLAYANNIDVLAQDVTLIVLLVLLGIKIGVWAYTSYAEQKN